MEAMSQPRAAAQSSAPSIPKSRIPKAPQSAKSWRRKFKNVSHSSFYLEEKYSLTTLASEADPRRAQSELVQELMNELQEKYQEIHNESES